LLKKANFYQNIFTEERLSPFTWKYGQEIVYHILTGYSDYK